MGPLDPEIAAGYGSPLYELFLRQGISQRRKDGKYWFGESGLTGADPWIHGHTHQNCEYAIHGTRFKVNALKSYPFKPENCLVRILDGLRHSFNVAIKSTVRKLDEAIDIGCALSLPHMNRNNSWYIMPLSKTNQKYH